MGFKGKVNELRRTIMHSLTRNIGRTVVKNPINDSSNLEINRILISRPNSRLGNQLMMTPLVQEISEIFPNCKIDLFVRGNLASIIFENYPNVDRLIKLPKKPFKEIFKYISVWYSLKKYQYDIVLNVAGSSSSGRLSTDFANARFKFFNDSDEKLMKRYKDYQHMAKFPVYNFREYLNKLGYNQKEKEVPFLDIKLKPTEIANGKKVLDNMVTNQKKTICIYTFATGDKCYSELWWDEVYKRMKFEYEETCNILEVLPIENISQIGFKAISYYSKDIREIAAVIANTELFLGSDSGVMHLASSSKTPTVGLFSITDINTYQPYNKGSIAIDTNKTNVDGIIEAMNKILNGNAVNPQDIN